MGSFLMLFAEILVAVLLVATVITSVRLSKRIAKLQADEQAMRNTIVELNECHRNRRARHRGFAQHPR